MSPFDEFLASAPTTFAPTEAPGMGTYKYALRGKDCTLGVLFEDSVNVYFEWLTECGCPVPYRPELRYKSWRKREVARLVCAGVWEVEGLEAVAA